MGWLDWGGHVVVFADVKLANGASARALQQPLVNAVRVEVVQARHRAHTVALLVIHDADHALPLTVQVTII